ncbi:MAG: hypothetical protein EXR69_14065 [Myxococcales bacterium]|nr:hypothetical protein [Myxococcales bacterium]
MGFKKSLALVALAVVATACKKGNLNFIDGNGKIVLSKMTFVRDPPTGDDFNPVDLAPISTQCVDQYHVDYQIDGLDWKTGIAKTRLSHPSEVHFFARDPDLLFTKFSTTLDEGPWSAAEASSIQHTDNTFLVSLKPDQVPHVASIQFPPSELADPTKAVSFSLAPGDFYSGANGLVAPGALDPACPNGASIQHVRANQRGLCSSFVPYMPDHPTPLGALFPDANGDPTDVSIFGRLLKIMEKELPNQFKAVSVKYGDCFNVGSAGMRVMSYLTSNGLEGGGVMFNVQAQLSASDSFIAENALAGGPFAALVGSDSPFQMTGAIQIGLDDGFVKLTRRTASSRLKVLGGNVDLKIGSGLDQSLTSFGGQQFQQVFLFAKLPVAGWQDLGFVLPGNPKLAPPCGGGGMAACEGSAGVALKDYLPQVTKATQAVAGVNFMGQDLADAQAAVQNPASWTCRANGATPFNDGFPKHCAINLRAKAL